MMWKGTGETFMPLQDDLHIFLPLLHNEAGLGKHLNATWAHFSHTAAVGWCGSELRRHLNASWVHFWTQASMNLWVICLVHGQFTCDGHKLVFHEPDQFDTHFGSWISSYLPLKTMVSVNSTIIIWSCCSTYPIFVIWLVPIRYQWENSGLFQIHLQVSLLPDHIMREGWIVVIISSLWLIRLYQDWQK